MAAPSSMEFGVKAALAFLLSIAILLSPNITFARQAAEVALPPVTIDALEGFQWSNEQVIGAPGQRIVVTNRDVQRHTFVVAEWDIDENLPTLVPVELTIPVDVELGSVVSFFSSVGDDRARGLEGTITIVTADEILDEEDVGLRSAGTIQNRQTIEAHDDFTFTPDGLDIEPGAFIEVRNSGVIEHHFVIDDWDVNETIPAGDVAIVQVPEDVDVGESFSFYCSVPGHLAQGMTGKMTVVPGRSTVETLPPERSGRVSVAKDLRPFVPDADVLGPDWQRLRVGAADTLLDGDDTLSSNIFPYDGLGAIYVGPQGSRVTLIVLPVTEEALPANQVKDAIGSVQNDMIVSWNKDRIGTASFLDVAPPVGCDTAQRASGIVPVLTIPAGATACQLRSAGVAIFVSVEGNVGEATGVHASDDVIEMLLTQTAPGEAMAPDNDR